MGSGKMARWRGVWGRQSGWDALRGCSGGSPGMVRRSGAMGDTVVIDVRVDDVAAHVDA